MAIRAQGTVIEWRTGVNVGIAEVTGFSGLGGGTTTEVDISHLGSTAKEFLAGLRDNGTITLNLNLNTGDTAQREIWAALNAGTLQEWGIVIPSSPTVNLNFFGVVLTFEIGASVDDAYRATITIRVSGAVTGFPAPP